MLPTVNLPGSSTFNNLLSNGNTQTQENFLFNKTELHFYSGEGQKGRFFRFYKRVFDMKT